jgi:hypothetical protein
MGGEHRVDFTKFFLKLCPDVDQICKGGPSLTTSAACLAVAASLIVAMADRCSVVHGGIAG